ncbi:MAG: hypothetical protein ACXVXO_11575, partial [Mycobacteriaceae bacterium]
MNSLLAQTHLGVLFLDRDTRAPIARMPVYAEASIAVVDEPPMVSVDLPGANDDYLQQQTLGPVLRQALANGMEDGGFDALSPEQRHALVQALRQVLGQKYPNILALPPAAMRAAAADAV